MSRLLKLLFSLTLITAYFLYISPPIHAQEASPSSSSDSFFEPTLHEDLTTYLEGQAFYQDQPEPTNPSFNQSQQLTAQAGVFRKLAPQTYQDELKIKFIKTNPNHPIGPDQIPARELNNHLPPLPKNFPSSSDYQTDYQIWMNSDNQKWFNLWPYVPMFSRPTGLLGAIDSFLRPSEANYELANLLTPADQQTPRPGLTQSIFNYLTTIIGVFSSKPQTKLEQIQPQTAQTNYTPPQTINPVKRIIHFFKFLSCQKQRLLLTLSPSGQYTLSPECQSFTCSSDCNPNPAQAQLPPDLKQKVLNQATNWHGTNHSATSQSRVNEKYDQVVQQSIAAGVDPIFTLAIWLHETAASDYTNICLAQNICDRVQDFGINKEEVETQFNRTTTNIIEDHFNDQLSGFLNLPGYYQYNYCASEMTTTQCPMLTFSSAYRNGLCDPTPTPDLQETATHYLEQIQDIYNRLAPDQIFPCYPIKLSD